VGQVKAGTGAQEEKGRYQKISNEKESEDGSEAMLEFSKGGIVQYFLQKLLRYRLEVTCRSSYSKITAASEGCTG
jgi:hypothetical protein